MAVEAIKWLSEDDYDFMKQRLTWIDGLRPLLNTRNQGVMIFTKREREFHWSDTVLTQHTIVLNMDSYGECVHEEVMPFRTHIREAKKRAEQLLTEFRAMGHEIISD